MYMQICREYGHTHTHTHTHTQHHIYIYISYTIYIWYYICCLLFLIKWSFYIPANILPTFGQLHCFAVHDFLVCFTYYKSVFERGLCEPDVYCMSFLMLEYWSVHIKTSGDPYLSRLDPIKLNENLRNPILVWNLVNGKVYWLLLFTKLVDLFLFNILWRYMKIYDL